MDGQMFTYGALTMDGEQKATAETIRDHPQLAALCILVAIAEAIPEGHILDQRKEQGGAAGQPERPQARLLQQSPH